MASLLYSATDRHGKPVEGFVEAGSLREAREGLENAGMSGIRIWQDPGSGGGTQPQILDGLNASHRREVARIMIAAMAEPGLLPMLRGVARMNRWWLAVDLGFLLWGLATSSAWLMAMGAGLALFPFAVALWNYRHGGRYSELLGAFATGDWPRVEALAAKLRNYSAKVPNMAFDLDLRLACIQARRGGLREALASLEPWREKLASQPGLYEHRLSTLYHCGEDREGFVRMMAAGHACAPNDPSRTIDLALAHARFGDAAEARRLCEALDASLLPPWGAGFIGWTKGLILLREGDTTAALQELAGGVASFLQFGSNPAVWTALAFCTCDYAIGLSLAGRKDAGRRELAQVWPIVKAHADKSLLRMLQADGLAPN